MEKVKCLNPKCGPHILDIPLPAPAAGRHSLPMTILNGNTAPTDAMSEAVSKAVMPVSEEEFRAELRYRMSLSVAKAMLEKGIISGDEYSEIDTILLEKYRPILGTLLAGKPLI